MFEQNNNNNNKFSGEFWWYGAFSLRSPKYVNAGQQHSTPTPTGAIVKRWKIASICTSRS